jgi:hypothetical protein
VSCEAIAEAGKEGTLFMADRSGMRVAGMKAPVPSKSKWRWEPVVQEMTKPTALTAPKIEEEQTKFGSMGIPKKSVVERVAVAPPLEMGEGDEVSNREGFEKTLLLKPVEAISNLGGGGVY